MAVFTNNGRRKSVFMIDLGGSDEAVALCESLDNYIALTGKTKKVFILHGLAQEIDSNGDNPALVMQIADYLVSRGRRRR